jgi:hypothetical protein
MRTLRAQQAARTRFFSLAVDEGKKGRKVDDSEGKKTAQKNAPPLSQYL